MTNPKIDKWEEKPPLRQNQGGLLPIHGDPSDHGRQVSGAQKLYKEMLENLKSIKQNTPEMNRNHVEEAHIETLLALHKKLQATRTVSDFLSALDAIVEYSESRPDEIPQKIQGIEWNRGLSERIVTFLVTKDHDTALKQFDSLPPNIHLQLRFFWQLENKFFFKHFSRPFPRAVDASSRLIEVWEELDKANPPHWRKFFVGS